MAMGWLLGWGGGRRGAKSSVWHACGRVGNSGRLALESRAPLEATGDALGVGAPLRIAEHCSLLSYALLTVRSGLETHRQVRPPADREGITRAPRTADRA